MAKSMNDLLNDANRRIQQLSAELNRERLIKAAVMEDVIDMIAKVRRAHDALNRDFELISIAIKKSTHSPRKTDTDDLRDALAMAHIHLGGLRHLVNDNERLLPAVARQLSSSRFLFDDSGILKGAIQ